MRILVVDDNEVNREIACAILDMEGAMSETAENGKLAVEAIDKAEAGYFDCVLMDVQMPVMNGYDATRAIRALPDRAKANTPIIAVSANAVSEDVEEAMNAGMDAHTSKPIDLAKLIDAIASAISKRSA
jgi:CheY-like chemotaxis protein